MSQVLLDVLNHPPARGEKRFLLDGVEWADYKMLCHAAERWGGVRVSFLDGVVELMVPSFEHESRKCLVGLLLEDYLFQNDIEYFPHGSTTMHRALKRAGKEPDASYCFHRQKKTPDLAIEVAITSGGIDTLEIYRRWSIPEVWIWQRENLHVYILENGAYSKSRTSRWFPDLNLRLLSDCTRMESGLQAKKKFRGGKPQK